ncbi:MAG: tRNA (N(6)-L-threonylcarbamoyladenosine(37)-C(2))-methylthiotransferase MtaB [Ruminococcaceae bacterium]|nr:tRNA (N(6)-L-threonylcarbamoyladenosine(37)-C(2))-methylthiotransferase MtaB [Oscillospiraceae bacterium]
MEKKVAFCTLGCKVNQYESEAVLEQFLKQGYTQAEFSEPADVYVVNTCTVTHLSDRKSRQMIRRAKQMNPEAVLVVMGCYTQTNPKAVLDIPDVDIVIGTEQRIQTVSLVDRFLTERKPINLVEELANNCGFEPLSIDGSGQPHTRAFLKVQDGCNQFCSYCIIPYARGRIRSRSIEDTVNEAKRLVEAGFCELVLTGIHLASWGKDSGEGTLLTLLEALQQVEGLRRIRLGSLEPTLCDEAFVRGVTQLDKVCHHFHLSLQSGCDATLKRMNRKYTTQVYAEAVERIRQAMPEAAITTDVIVGFPGETEEEFAETVEFLKKISLSDAHIFKYSPRQGTPAAKMPGQISPAIKEVRSKELILLTAKTKQQFESAYIGKQEWVLFEQEANPGVYEGKTQNYMTVLVSCNQNLTGKMLPVLIESCTKGVLQGKIMQA